MIQVDRVVFLIEPIDGKSQHGDGALHYMQLMSQFQAPLEEGEERVTLVGDKELHVSRTTGTLL